MTAMKKLTLYRETGDGRVEEVDLPTRFALCPACQGRGTTTRHVEHDGGGITASEMEELGEDFREDYLAGVYDRPCDACDGLRVVPVVDESRLDAGTLAAWERQCDDDADFDALCEAERRMGC